jgi:hypothetical protein
MVASNVDHPVFSKEAPVGISPPPALLEETRGQSRSRYVLEHGPTEGDIKPAWWSEEGIQLSFRKTNGNSPRLTRSDLFAMGENIGSDNDVLLFVWHVLAWGSGGSRRNNRQRIAGCGAHVKLLRQAYDAARASDPRAAYGSLIRRGGAVIPQFGPAFFTKFLYFACGSASPRCLILDARVARSMYRLGWNMAPTYPTKNFSYNWYTDTYVSYCDLLHVWAERGGPGITPDMLERALFDSGGS